MWWAQRGHGPATTKPYTSPEPCGDTVSCSFKLSDTGPEAFNEVRRTGFPKLKLSANAELDALPARFPYPTEEALYNPTNYKEIELTEPVWFMK